MGSSVDLNEAQAPLFERLLNTKAAAELLGIHPKTLERMARDGQIPAIRIGKLWRFRASELDHWVKSQVKFNSQFVRVN